MTSLCVNIGVIISAILMMLLIPASGSFTDLNKSLGETVIIARDTNGLQSPLYGRIIFAVLSLIMICALSAMLAIRIRFARKCNSPDVNLPRCIVLTSYPLAILFLFTSGLLISSWSYGAVRLCKVSIEACLAFYVTSKMILYFFFLERGRMFNHGPRYKDPFYIFGAILIFPGTGAIAIAAFILSHSKQVGPHGICKIGLAKPVVIALLAYDTYINIYFTGLYLYLASKNAGHLTWESTRKLIRGAMPFHNHGKHPAHAVMLQHMMAKSIIGSLLVVFVTTVNLGLLIIFDGHEDFWLCMTLCCIDTTWNVVIIHWLSSNPYDVDDTQVLLELQNIALNYASQQNGPMQSGTVGV